MNTDKNKRVTCLLKFDDLIRILLQNILAFKHFHMDAEPCKYLNQYHI